MGNGYGVLLALVLEKRAGACRSSEGNEATDKSDYAEGSVRIPVGEFVAKPARLPKRCDGLGFGRPFLWEDRMWEFYFKYADKAYRAIGHLDRTQWILVLVGIVLVGAACLRGYGSRTNY